MRQMTLTDLLYSEIVNKEFTFHLLKFSMQVEL